MPGAKAQLRSAQEALGKAWQGPASADCQSSLTIINNSHLLIKNSFKQVQLTTADGRRLRLADIATVTDGIADPSTRAWLDGRETIGFEA